MTDSASSDRIGRLEERLGYRFRNQELLFQALTHKSYANERKGLRDNERMEFLGDAVLDLCISQMIMEMYPEMSEGEMSKLRASVVNEPSLAAVALEVGVPENLRLGHGEERSGGREKSSIMADSLEAIIAGIYQDGGFEEVFSTVRRVFDGHISISGLRQDFKTMLQELTQERFRCTPVYNVMGSKGPDHAKTFEVEIVIDGRSFGMGKGRTKKEAEQDAARKAIDAIPRDKGE